MWIQFHGSNFFVLRNPAVWAGPEGFFTSAEHVSSCLASSVKASCWLRTFGCGAVGRLYFRLFSSESPEHSSGGLSRAGRVEL